MLVLWDQTLQAALKRRWFLFLVAPHDLNHSPGLNIMVDLALIFGLEVLKGGSTWNETLGFGGYPYFSDKSLKIKPFSGGNWKGVIIFRQGPSKTIKHLPIASYRHALGRLGQQWSSAGSDFQQGGMDMAVGINLRWTDGSHPLTGQSIFFPY